MSAGSGVWLEVAIDTRSSVVLESPALVITCIQITRRHDGV